MCSGVAGGPSLEGVDLDKATVIQGTVTHGGAPVPGAYVRLLDSSGEFTAEVPTSATGGYRFFAAPGTWRVRVLSRNGNGERVVSADVGTPVDADVEIPA